jgi:hypothetical protein
MADETEFQRRVAALSEDRQMLLKRLQARAVPSVPPPSRRPAGLVRIPMTPAQEYLWDFCERRPPGDPTRNITIASLLEGPLDAGALQQALDALVAGTEALRTVFGSDGGRPYQTVQPPFPAPFTVDDLTHLPEAERDTAAWHLVNEQDLNAAFDLATGPLFRARLIRLGEQRHVLSISVHHIISDGTGCYLICTRLADLYQAALDGRELILPAALGQADYAYWLRQHYLPSGEMARHVEYWRELLADAKPASLPTDRVRPPQPTYEGTYYRHRCSTALRNRIAQASRDMGATPLMLLVAAFSAIVTRQTGSTDFVFTTDTPGRGHSEWENAIGLFVNTLFLRMRTDGDPTFGELVGRAREVLLDAWSHEAAPAHAVLAAIRPDTGSEALSHMTVQYLEGQTGAGILTLPGLRSTNLELVLHRSRRDLSLSAMELDGGIEFWIEYSTYLFTEDRIRGLLNTLERVLSEGIIAPKTLLSELACDAPG